MNMKTKFQFGADFGEVEPLPKIVECVEEPPPEPIFVETDLVAADAKGFARGREEGLEAAQNSIENTLTQNLAIISEQLTAMSARHTEAWDACQRHALALAVSITRKLAPDLANDSAPTVIEQRIADALPRLLNEPRVVIRVPDQILDALQTRIDEIAAAAGFAGQCILLSDNGLTGPDCHIEWADGGVEFDSRRLWQEIDAEVEAYLCSAMETSNDAAADAAPQTDHATPNDNPQEMNDGR